MVKAHLKLLNIVKADPIHFFLFGSLLILFLVTRLLHLDKIPPSVYWDEASIGYNAYAISQTLRDEWGDFLPIHFRAFGEFKLPVYIYSVVPFVKLFGLNAFSVRLPAVIYSLGTLILVYHLSRNIIKNEGISLFAPFFLTLSPWFFIFSRTGYEATAGVFFLLLSFYLFIIGLTQKNYLIGWMISCVLAIYSYNSMRIIVPVIFVLQLIFLLRAKVSVKHLAVGTITLFLAFVPIVRLMILDSGTSRFLAVGQQGFLEILKNYLSHFTPVFLFGGDINSRSTIPGFGVIWPHEIIILIIGFWAIIKNKNIWGFLILISFLTSFLPSAITKEAPHALRSLSAVVFLAIIFAFGINFIHQRYKKFLVYFTTGVILVTIFFFEGYIKHFMDNYSSLYSSHWQYGYSQIYEHLASEIESADKVVISEEYAQPYIFALFNLKYDPESFLKERRLGRVENWGFSTVEGFGKFEFRKVEPSDISSGSILFVGPEERPKFPPESSKIKFLDGSDALYVYIP